MPDQPTRQRGRAKSNAQRAADVEAAVAAVTVALRAALANPDDQAAWAEVKRDGATIHRQSRLLAGKSNGG